MKARLYCRSRSLLVLTVSASGAPFDEGWSSVEVTPLTSGLGCLCHVRGLYQALGMVVISFMEQLGRWLDWLTHCCMFCRSLGFDCSQDPVQGRRRLGSFKYLNDGKEGVS